MIPRMNQSGVLSPFLPDAGPTHRAGMAPYLTSTDQLAQEFAFSDERKDIFQGLLELRKALCDAGVSDGFQWVAGSYLEDCEALRGRPPNDVDIVTFFRRPPELSAHEDWAHFVRSHMHIFDRNQSKDHYGCDAFFVDLSLPTEHIVDQTRYWFGLFSHQRATYLWKGILQVPLCDGDRAAQAVLDEGGDHAS